MTVRVIRASYSFPRACASPAISWSNFSKEFSVLVENGCENEKLFCKGQPEWGAQLTFMPFRSSSELLFYMMKKPTYKALSNFGSLFCLSCF